MVVIIKKSDSIQEMNRKLKKLGFMNKSKGGIDARKFCGTLSTKIDGLEFQKRMRAEWDREPVL